MANLTSTFPQPLNYFLEKLTEGVYSKGKLPQAKISIQRFREALEAFKHELEVRGTSIEKLEHVFDVYKSIQHALDRLDKYFYAKEYRQKNRLNAKDADVFIVFVSHKIKELMDMAEEIENGI